MTGSKSFLWRWIALCACVLALLTTAACAVGGARRSGDNSLTVINGADGPLCSLRIKRASSQTFWGRNRLGNEEQIAPGDTFVIDRLAEGYYDLDALLCDDNAHPGFGRYDVAVGPESAAEWVVGQPWHTDIAELGRLINLPLQPDQAMWQVRQKGVGNRAIGPTDTELVAVLELDEATFQELEGRLDRQTSPTDLFVVPEFVQPWFPEPIRQAFVADPANPGYLRLTADRYQPALFANNSLASGYVILVDGLVFVYLHST